jgi:hypothetical protein
MDSLKDSLLDKKKPNESDIKKAQDENRNYLGKVVGCR